MKKDDSEKMKLNEEINMNDGVKSINDAFENKRKRLLNSLTHEKEIQMRKLNEDFEIQEKRITDFINFERENMIKAFKEEMQFKELKKKLNLPNYEINQYSSNQEGMMRFFRKGDVVDKKEKK